MDINNLKNILNKVTNKKIGIIGDCCLDIYWDIDMKLSTLSLETPEFPMPIINERFNLGAGGNVVNNLADLKVKKIELITVFGDDWRKDIIHKLLENLKIVNLNNIIISKNRVTPAYCKPIKHGISNVVYEASRLDFWNLNKIDSNIESSIIKKLYEIAEKVDVILVVDQLKNGVITDKVRESLADLGSQGKTIIVDSRDNAYQYKNVILKPNEKELIYMANKLKVNYAIKDLISLAKELSALLNSEMIVTLGEQGSFWISNDNIYQKDAFKVEGEIDIVGAGDGFISGLACLYQLTSKDEILLLCNLISSIIIKKIGQTGSASPDEIFSGFIFNTKTPYIEILKSIDNKKINCVIFDFDGTISTLRSGWEKIMLDYVFKQLSKYYIGKEDELKDKIIKFINDTTGVQTIFQMQWIVDQVKESGGKPLDQWSYKEGYNQALSELVNKRISLLHEGKKNPIEFRIPGSKEFLERLVSKNIKCFIASGTDDIDVKNEMKILEIDSYFEDVKGAPYKKVLCPKEAIYKELVDELGYKPEEILIIGDGRVEIKIGNEGGSVTLGIASNESDFNYIDMKKRERLLNAKADAIVKDFTNYKDIIDWMEG